MLPPLVLAKIIDGITAGDEVSASFLLLYFLLLALTGFLEAAREGLLTVFGQKMTHALRSSLMEKFGSLTSDNVNRQEPGMLVSRFVGDVDTVENLFTSGIVSMFADACKIISILAVIWFRNRGLTFVLLVLLPFLFWFTRHVQKNMLSAQIENGALPLPRSFRSSENVSPGLSCHSLLHGPPFPRLRRFFPCRHRNKCEADPVCFSPSPHRLSVIASRSSILLRPRPELPGRCAIRIQVFINES